MILASRSLDMAHPALAEKVLMLMEDFSTRHAPFSLLITSVWRDQRLQAALYAQGRALPEEVNAIRAGLGLTPLRAEEAARVVTWTRSSKHTRRPSEAVDLAVVLDPDGPDGPIKPVIDWQDEGRYRAMGALAERLGLVWGGSWARHRDLCHVELRRESDAQAEEK